MPRAWNRLGFAEAGPRRMVQDLLFLPDDINNSNNHGTNNFSSIAITSRFPRDIDPYADAIREYHNATMIRKVTNQTGVQDFCFLQSAQYFLVGPVRSTFSLYAGFLGKANHVLWYHALRADNAHPQHALPLPMPMNTTWAYEFDGQKRHFTTVLLEDVTDWR